MAALRSDGHDLGRTLACSGLARSTYYYALEHPAGPTRPELRGAVAETFSRTPNGCGHRQAAMCLRAELGARVADKTVLKMMREMGPAAASAARCLCQVGNEQCGTRNLSSLADGLVKRSPFRASAPHPCGGSIPRTR